MSLALLILILSISSLTVRADDDSVWPVVIGALAFLVCYRAWIRSKHDKMFSNFKDTTTHASVETAPLPPVPPPQSEPPPIYNLEYGPTFNTPDSFFNPQNAPHPLGITQLSYYPPISGYIQENPMTITQPYSCQTERTNVVTATDKTWQKHFLLFTICEHFIINFAIESGFKLQMRSSTLIGKVLSIDLDLKINDLIVF
ncbi:hypothetical protein ACTXT7_007973 [Hymenolepis weldensis]